MTIITKWAVLRPPLINKKEPESPQCFVVVMNSFVDTKEEAEVRAASLQKDWGATTTEPYRVVCMGWDDGILDPIPEWEHEVARIKGEIETGRWVVPAIKRVREMEGVGLKEAKDMVDARRMLND